MQVIKRKKQQGVEAVSLLPIAKRKNKRENAMLFFELLVSIKGKIKQKFCATYQIRPKQMASKCISGWPNPEKWP